MRLQKKAFEVEKVVREIPGAAGVAASRVQGKPYLNIEVDRVAMARYGLRAQDVLDVVEAGLGGKNVTTTIEGRQRFPIQVRFERDERDDIERLADVLVFTPVGQGHPARPGREDPARPRAQRDRERERAAAGLRAGQRAGPRPRRLRQGSARARSRRRSSWTRA